MNLNFGNVFRSAFVFRDKKTKVSMEAFFKPLALSVWISTLISIALLSVVLRAAFRVEEIFRTNAETSWSYAFLVTIATFCQQGNFHTTSLVSARIVIVMSLLLSLLIYQFYSGTLVSFLLMKPSASITSVGDIVKSGMKVGCEDILYIHDFLQVTELRYL